MLADRQRVCVRTLLAVEINKNFKDYIIQDNIAQVRCPPKATTTYMLKSLNKNALSELFVSLWGRGSTKSNYGARRTSDVKRAFKDLCILDKGKIQAQFTKNLKKLVKLA